MVISGYNNLVYSDPDDISLSRLVLGGIWGLYCVTICSASTDLLTVRIFKLKLHRE